MKKSALGWSLACLMVVLLEVCLRFDKGDAKRQADIDSGASVADLVQRKYK